MQRRDDLANVNGETARLQLCEFSCFYLEAINGFY